MNRYLSELLICVLLLVGCVPDSTRLRNSPMDKTGWITYCFGRFLIDLPPKADVRTNFAFWGDSIELSDETPSSLPARLDVLEGKLNAQQHRRGGSMFLRRVDLGGGSTGLLSWFYD